MTELQEAVARSRRALAAAFGFSVVVNVLMLTVALYMLQVYDRVLTSGSVETLAYLTLMAVAALGLLGLFEILRSRVLVHLGAWFDRVLSPSVFLRGLENALAGAAYRTEALRDLGAVRSFLAGAGVLALFDTPWVPVFILVIFLLHPALGLFALGGAAALLLLTFIAHALARGSLVRSSEFQSESMRYADAAFQNAEAVDGMGMNGALARRWDSLHGAVLIAQTKASDVTGTFTGMTKALRLVLQVGILGLGAWLVLQAQLTPGAMIAASIILGRALAPVEQATAAWRQMVGAHAAWCRLADMLDAPPKRSAGMALPRPEGHLGVESVVYLPPGARVPVIKGVSFEAEPGDVVAVIGPSAAGKSTLARLLVGLGRPQSGQVRLDGADVFALPRTTFGRHVGYLPQDVELFPATIRENIARMEDGDPVQVVRAAKMAGVHEMILSLPEAYETCLSHPGGMLSGGQRQRIGLARALYGEPPLLVLDEPNAHLDSAGEAALNRAIREAKAKGTTIVIVAHRPSLMAHVDKVALMNDGRLEMFDEQRAVLERLQRRARLGGGERAMHLVGQGA